MFTFSFSSAFAAVDWTGETASKYLTEQGDYELGTAVTGEPVGGDVSKRGTEGITEAYRAELTAEAKAELKYVKSGTPFYAPEKAEAISLIEAYIESLKTVKTAKDAKELKDKLEKEVGIWNGTTTTINSTVVAAVGATPAVMATLKQKADVRTAAADPTTGIAAAGTATVDITRIVARAAGNDLYLPGYVTLNKTTNVKTTAGTPSKSELALTSGTAATAATIFVASPAAGVHADVVDWFMNNDYRAKGDFEAGARAFAAALKAKDAAYTKTVTDEFDAIQTEIYKYVDKAATARRGLPVSDLEGVDALVKKINDFNKKYAGFGLTFTDAEFKSDIANTAPNAVSLAANYFDQYYSEVAAIPEVKKLTDADKATVVALYKKVMALEDSYDDVWTYVDPDADAATFAYDFAKLKDAYKHFLKKDVKAYGELAKFDEMTKGTADKYYFDASEKNVNALKAKRAAFDALVKDYGYADLSKNGMSYVDAAKAEALILAAEHNMTADADYDVKDTTKVQAYLNNATVKVTTKALGNNKIRVNAKIDTVSFEKILGEMETGSTVSYKFYHKTAKATAYKAAKEKDRNYITYTKKSLKKGTKYNFQCAVIIKDANGNVVATKDYQASTIGSRVCR